MLLQVNLKRDHHASCARFTHCDKEVSGGHTDRLMAFKVIALHHGRKLLATSFAVLIPKVAYFGGSTYPAIKSGALQ